MHVRSAALICLACAAPSLAAEPLAALLACRNLAAPAERLACFDRESGKLAPGQVEAAGPQGPTPIPAPAVAAAHLPTPAPAPAPTPDPNQQFGLPPHPVVENKVSAIETHIKGLSPGAGGRVVFTLDNGQVWGELEPDGDLQAKPGDLATISRGWLGSYWLQVKSGRASKVSRVR